jgi:hypothetical protein
MRAIKNILIAILIIGGIVALIEWNSAVVKKQQDARTTELFNAVLKCGDTLQENLDTYRRKQDLNEVYDDLWYCMETHLEEYPGLDEGVTQCSEYIFDNLTEYSSGKNDFKLHNNLSDCMSDYFPYDGSGYTSEY